MLDWLKNSNLSATVGRDFAEIMKVPNQLILRKRDYLEPALRDESYPGTRIL